jgi:hypothetical protein
LFKGGIEVSFSSRARAGGFSVSPSFTYFPVVDGDVAPAFLVMSLLVHDTRKLRNINETRSKTILSAAQRKLQELFCSGRASPNDVDQDSSTLLHLLCYIVRSDEVRAEQTIRLTSLGTGMVMEFANSKFTIPAFDV